MCRPKSTSSGLLRGGLFGGSRDIVDTVQLLWQAADDPRVVGAVRRHRRRIRRPRARAGAAPGDRPFPRQGKVRRRLRRIAGQRRHALRRLLSRLGAGADLAAAERRLRRGRHRRRDAVHKTGLDKLGVQGRGRQALRVQERARHVPGDRLHRRRRARTCSSSSTASMASSSTTWRANATSSRPSCASSSMPCRSIRSGARQENLVDKVGYRSRCMDEVWRARRQDPRSHPAGGLCRRRGAAQAARRGGGAGARQRRHRIRSGQRRSARRRRRGAGRGCRRRARRRRPRPRRCAPSCCASIRPAAPIPPPTPSPTPSAAPARPASR